MLEIIEGCSGGILRKTWDIKATRAIDLPKGTPKALRGCLANSTVATFDLLDLAPHLCFVGGAAQKVFARAGSRKPCSDQHQECSTTDNHGYRLLGRPDFPATSQHSPPGARQNQPLVVPALITAPAHRRHRQLTVMFCDLDSSTALLSGD